LTSGNPKGAKSLTLHVPMANRLDKAAIRRFASFRDALLVESEDDRRLVEEAGRRRDYRGVLANQFRERFPRSARPRLEETIDKVIWNSQRA
jgi:hypothetical protein